MNELSLELESEGSIAAAILVVLPSIEAVIAAVREHLQVDHELHLFEKDKDDELHSVAGRRAMGLRKAGPMSESKVVPPRPRPDEAPTP